MQSNVAPFENITVHLHLKKPPKEIDHISVILYFYAKTQDMYRRGSACPVNYGISGISNTKIIKNRVKPCQEY